MAESLIGKTIGKYQIVEHLGRGGMAEVYKAHQPALDRYVAIKLMHSFLADDKDFLGRFQREARAVASLRHGNIVRVYDFDVADGVYYMVMEFIDGYTLKALLEGLTAKDQRMPLREALRITEDLASALAYAARRDMVHRDVKPANVMINRENQVILTDFGIAKILSGPQFTASGAMIGTPAYMSPEQGLGEAGDARSDIYSLGVMLFEMSTGRRPFDADTPLAVVLKHVNAPIPIPSSINPDLPPDVERVILKAIAKEPDDRYQTGGELAEHLAMIKRGVSVPETVLAARGAGGVIDQKARTVIGVPSATVQAPVAPPTRRGGWPAWLWLAVGGAAVVLFLLGIAAVSGLSGFLGSRTPTPAVAGGTPRATEAGPASTPAGTPQPTATPLDLVGAASTALAQQNATLTALAPTASPTPVATRTPSRTLTPSPTPTLACELGYELVAYFTYGNPNNYNSSRNQTLAPVDRQFSFTARLLNQGTCAWPAGTQLVFIGGDALEADEEMTADSETEVGDTAEFDTSMTSGSQTGLFSSHWGLQLPDGTEVGDPLEIRVLVYEPATPTPTAPPQPVATPTSEQTGPIDFNWFISSCEYIGTEWRCLMTVTPFGGIGEPYTMWVFDTAQGTRYYGGNQQFWVTARRCSPWIHDIKLQDDGGNSITKGAYIDPNAYFSCTP